MLAGLLATRSVSPAVALTPATFTWSARVLTVTTGPVTTSLTAATFTWSASALAPTPPLSNFVSFPPALPPKGRAALGGALPSLGANIQGYPAEEVEEVMRSGVAICRPRFELYDVLGNRVRPDLGGVTAASVEYDDTREIKGSLELTLRADERLRHAFWQYLVLPYFGIGPMPSDGGFAEIPQGLYPWTRPKRNIEGTTGEAETWTIVIGDQGHFLDASGPGRSPFQLTAGFPAYHYVRVALWFAGIATTDDFAGVTVTDLGLPADTWYTNVTTARRNPADGTWRNEGAAKWLTILQDLHKALGWQEPWFSVLAHGQYQGRPDRDWVNEPADVIYDTADDGVMLLPVTTEPDLKMIANRVTAESDTTGQSSEGSTFGYVPNYYVEIADLNDFLPQHPLAQVNTRHYIDADPIVKGAFPDSGSAFAAAVVELFKRLPYYEKMTLQRKGMLAVHDGSPIVGVQVANDRELAGPVPLFQGLPEALPLEWQGLYDFTRPIALFRETGRKLDLFSADGESTLTRLARLQ